MPYLPIRSVEEAQQRLIVDTARENHWLEFKADLGGENAEIARDIAQRALARHPSLKPQAFLRRVVRAVLPLGQGVVLDRFAGSGSTLAAAEAVRYRSVGVEIDPQYVAMARKAIPKLARLTVED